MNLAEENNKTVIKKYAPLPDGYYAIFYRETKEVYYNIKRQKENVIWIINTAASQASKV